MASVSPRLGSTLAQQPPPPAARSVNPPPPKDAGSSSTTTHGGQTTISAHMSSTKRTAASSSKSKAAGRKRSQPEEAQHHDRPPSASSSTAGPLPDPTVRSASQSPTKRRPSPSTMVQQQRPPPPAPIQYYAHPQHLGGQPSFDPSLYYAVVPSHAGPVPHALHHPAPPPHHFVPHAPPPPPARRPSMASSSTVAGPSQRSVSPTKPTGPRPSLPPAELAAAPTQKDAPSSSATSKSPVKTEGVLTADDQPPPPKPKRKYTKKADFWIENGGPGRRGLIAASKADGTGAGTDSATSATPQPGSVAVSKTSSSAGSTSRKRAGSTTKRQQQGSKPTAASAASSTTAAGVSPVPRAATPLAGSLQGSMPRTISAPALLTAEDGKVSLSSTQVLATELAWLLPSRERLANTASRPARVPARLTPADEEAARERSRKRLAAFEDDEDALAFFASPHKENTRPPLVRGQSASRSAGGQPALVPARVAGMGRVAIAQGSLQRMMEAGARPLVESTPAAQPASTSLLASGLVAPDWPDSCHPWAQSEADRRRSQTDERREILLSVKQYLDSEDDDDEIGTSSGDDTPRRRTSSASSSVDDDALEWARRGGKSSTTLLSTHRQARLKSTRSVPSMATAFDPSDARQALIYRTHASAPHAAFEHDGYPGSAPSSAMAVVDPTTAADEQGPIGASAIACICQDHVAEGAMVECNGCTYWFHLPCLGIQEADLGNEWFCWRCAPAGDQLPTQLSEPAVVPRTPKTASPELADGSDAEADDPGTPATVALEPSPMFGGGREHGADPLGTPLGQQRFGTPLLPSATGFTSFPSPAYHRAGGGGSHHPHQQRLPPPLPLLLHHGTPGPSRPWDHRHILTPRVPSHTRDHEEALFDLSSTPSRHLTRELPFGGTPISRVGGGGRGGRGSTGGGPRLPSFGSFATPSQEFFSGLHASPHPSSSSGGQLPGLDHYLSSVDSSGPLSPYQPLHSKWHHSPSIQSHYPGAGGRGATPRSHLRPGSGDGRQVKEQERFGEPLEGLHAGFDSGRE